MCVQIVGTQNENNGKQIDWYAAIDYLPVDDVMPCNQPYIAVSMIRLYMCLVLRVYLALPMQFEDEK